MTDSVRDNSSGVGRSTRVTRTEVRVPDTQGRLTPRYLSPRDEVWGDVGVPVSPRTYLLDKLCKSTYLFVYLLVL